MFLFIYLLQVISFNVSNAQAIGWKLQSAMKPNNHVATRNQSNRKAGLGIYNDLSGTVWGYFFVPVPDQSDTGSFR